jgi:hypothetical protein
MPVIDLADYLGMPAQAPANPVFNQTRKSTGVASLDREVDDFYKGAAAIDQLRSLQRLAPVFEAQKAQFAYDEIAQKANDLRKKQEIEAQVERAASELAGGNLNPESDDFAVKYRDLATRNPLAFSDPRFSTVAGLYENQYKGYQQAKQQRAEAEARAAQARMEAEARSAKEIIDARNRAIAFGVPPEKLPRNAGLEQIAIEEGKVKVAGKGTRSGAASSDERRLSNILNVRAKEYEDAKKRVEDFDLKDTDQEFIDARNAWKEASKKYIQFNETGGVPAAEATQTGIGGVSGRTLGDSGIPARPKEQAAVPFKDTMKELAAPKAEDILKVNESEVLQGINDPSADENTYMATISDPNVSLKVKEKALINLRDYVNNPKPKTFANFSEGLQYAEKLENNLNDAEMQFSIEKDKSVANPVWDEVKSVMDSKIKEVAKKLNMTTETLLNSLIENEVLPGDKVGPEIVAKYGNVRSNEVPTRNIFKALSGVDWRNKIPSFEPLKKLPNAYNLGLSSGKTWTDVFDSYIDEKSRSPSQSPQPVQESIVEISNEEEVDALPKGSKFRGPDGKVRIK